MQLFVVHNPENGTIYVFDNHDAALRCRRDQGLNWEHLTGCVVFSDWNGKQPLKSGHQ